MGSRLENIIRISCNLAMLAGVTISLSGCIVYHAASTVVDAGATVVGAGASVVGGAADVVTAPFGSSDNPEKK
jgi:hypothetical protein